MSTDILPFPSNQFECIFKVLFEKLNFGIATKLYLEFHDATCKIANIATDANHNEFLTTVRNLLLRSIIRGKNASEAYQLADLKKSLKRHVTLIDLTKEDVSEIESNEILESKKRKAQKPIRNYELVPKKPRVAITRRLSN